MELESSVLRKLSTFFGLCAAAAASAILFPVAASDLDARDLTDPLDQTSQDSLNAEAEPSSAPTAEAAAETSEASGDQEQSEQVKATLVPDEVKETPSTSPTLPTPKVKTIPDVVRVITGEASWYGPGFYGNRTASGEVYRPGTMTAAHRTLPFGTKVRVTNLWNGRSAVIRINDRGPFVGHRVIDLGHGAASSLGLTASGIAQVRLEVLR